MSDLIEQLSPLQTVEQAEINKAFHDVFRTSAGKRVLFWMLEQCAIYQDAFCGEMTSATNYTLGTQAPGRRLIAKLDQLNPQMYPQLLMVIAEMKAIDKLAAETIAKNQEGEEHDVDA
jgi:hypothetical protein